MGSWIGALGLFGAAVVPAALRLVPSPAGGELVRAVLAWLNWGGVLWGGALALLGWRLRRGRLACAIPLFLVTLCLLSQLVVAPALTRARPSDPSNAQRPEAVQSFSFLHGVSMGLFGATLLGTFALAAWHGWREGHPAHTEVEGGGGG